MIGIAEYCCAEIDIIYTCKIKFRAAEISALSLALSFPFSLTHPLSLSFSRSLGIWYAHCPCTVYIIVPVTITSGGLNCVY